MPQGTHLGTGELPIDISPFYTNVITGAPHDSFFDYKTPFIKNHWETLKRNEFITDKPVIQGSPGRGQQGPGVLLLLGLRVGVHLEW